ncbi:MAG: hypothetical protein ABI857_10335 [Acidobacteriota bacterium]
MLKQFATLFLIAIFTPTLAIAQSTNAAASYDQPRAVNLDPLVRRTFPSYYGRKPYQRLYTDGFYPIGWSRDGKFAYYVEPVDEACGCYFAELVIQDLRTDEELWKFRNEPQSRVNDKGESIPDDMRKLWRRNQKMFSEKLREHGIVPQSRFALLGRTFVSGGRTYTAKVTAKKGNDSDDMKRVKSVELEFSTPRLGKKTIFTAAYEGDEMYVSPLEVAVAGAFKSPFENRAAIVMIRVQRGWEGPPHTVEAQIAGSDLGTGFKK